MIKLNTYFKKEALNKNNKEELLLLELEGFKKESKKSKKRKLNLSISIDTSGSMSLPVDNKEGFNPFGGYAKSPISLADLVNQNAQDLNKQIETEVKIPETKIQQAKRLAIKALEKMEDGDIISITTFDYEAKLILPSTVITKDNRAKIYSIIEELNAGGMTNLHDGWLMSATEVAKQLNEKYLNRILVLTDGEITRGVSDIDTISKDVMNLYTKSISTTTFGIGQDFAEDLLENMANNGGGNFYYITNSDDFDSMFEQEFSGLNNIAASDIRLTLELKKKYSVIEEYNDLSKLEEDYLVRNLAAGNKIPLLFKIKTKLPEDKESVKLGNIIIKYKDSEGKTVLDKVSLEAKVVSKKEWKVMEENEEVKVQEVLMTVALNKKKSTEALKNGDLNSAKDFLRTSMDIVGAAGINDSRLAAETISLDATLMSADNRDIKELRKDITYQSYMTRTGQ